MKKPVPFESAKQTVFNLLAENPAGRDDDRILIVDYLTKILHIELTMFDIKTIQEGSSFEWLTRARRIIQNNNKQLTASEPVKDKRAKHEVRIREAAITRTMYVPITNNRGEVVAFRQENAPTGNTGAHV